MKWWQKLTGQNRKPAQAAELETSGESLAASLALPGLVDFDALYAIANRRTEEYCSASPFPHVMLDNFLSDDVVDRLVAEFPQPQEDLNWRQFRSESETGELVQDRKLGMAEIEEMPPTIRELLWELNSGTFLRFLENLTGIRGLIADPRLRGGGIHQVLAQGVLEVHADFTNHTDYELDRRLNLLIYLNRDWPQEYGGDLELWSTDMSHCGRRIRPLAGRCVIFNTTQDSFHGHPHPLACPPDRTRKSIALYYYSNGRDDREVERTRKTNWQVRPDMPLPTAE